MILVIDNYDSFTYNIVQYLAEMGAKIRVYRSDALDLVKIAKLKPTKIVISPGPGRPETQGRFSCDLIREFYKDMPILGVCLGHQCIGYAFGAKIIKAPVLMHGKTSLIYHDRKYIFKSLSNPFEATRYHSLIIDKKTVPSNLVVNAKTKDGIIMGIKDKQYPLFGIQFHPESILTKEGKTLLKNFLSL
ncbi:MAG: aminodeoxychorismate/anthranilate synthase component II [Candidatus Omnitrophota bacterium]